MKNLRLQKMTAVAVAAAMGLILQFIAFPIVPMFPFLKLDFSDIPVLINMFIFGPLTGVATAFIRSLLHLTMTGFSVDNMIGDFASFFASTLYTLPIFLLFRKKNTSKRVLGLGLGILAMTLFMSIANYFVITPLYLKAFGLTAGQMLGMGLGRYILVGIVPFNLLKGMIVSVAFLVLHAKLLPWLSKKTMVSHHHSIN
ncbi:ECF transporter S component [Enterococcus dongliensis]|uniref:Riboflavin transporter n=1 Tax=Enterococcus dongliensis TaxID=2559925 RepID=A0AAP5KQF1_9ENTE|nr:ECF transporter S component [Enterococcus dongliensis]MDT2596074.1 ECF transporter S component [Enterococcus dongliensis]MDT2603516.1 ECF transporter S component [Enterococcus dongliensis]MDT2613757.1 ECF transporter S component [Enterococcus dongliensis]MDT2635274.1 ECF transporter S component [Enterococcus dongliensis]MDT2636928.1 ECF transporter S component [Enterococcus dongliensis]